MDFLNRLDESKSQPIKSYEDFWKWFQEHEKRFYQAIKNAEYIDRDFFNPLSSKLTELNEGYFYLVGIDDENSADLTFTADGVIKNFVLIEDLVKAAPAVKNWKFTALKEALPLKDININMDGFSFNKDNIFFYSNEHPNYPDEIDISLVYKNWNEKGAKTINSGVLLFLDNYLGELEFVTLVDEFEVVQSNRIKQELVPIHKLKSFLKWREKEFLEKYEGIVQNTDQAIHSLLEAKNDEGLPFVGILNTDLLKWEAKASHPWLMKIKIIYPTDRKDEFPASATNEEMNKLEDKIIEDLKDFESYLNLGRFTGKKNRNIYFACKEFRKPSRLLYQIIKQYEGELEINFVVYKDKYWRSVTRYVRS